MGNKIEIEGSYNKAIVFTEEVEDNVREQITEFLNEPFIEGEHIAIMPDTHVGKGAVIGTTMTTNNGKICPNLVGVDIGCGIMVTKIAEKDFDDRDFGKLDQVIKRKVPSGFNVNKTPEKFDEINDLTFKIGKKQRMLRSLGSLGGGNHFIELAKNDSDEYSLTIHSGSRGFGYNISSHHQEIAKRYSYPKKGEKKVGSKALAYLEGEELDNYLNDLYIAQKYASRNRQLMTEKILEGMNWTKIDQFDSVHNYIDPELGILRKGATDATEGKRLIIPLNMRDGSIIAEGKGNPEWNYSAPHGAGRVLSRTQAKKELSLEFFKAAMSDVYSTSVRKNTLDESPMAYKEVEDIVDNITDTVEILEYIRPVYNFKA